MRRSKRLYDMNWAVYYFDNADIFTCDWYIMTKPEHSHLFYNSVFSNTIGQNNILQSLNKCLCWNNFGLFLTAFGKKQNSVIHLILAFVLAVWPVTIYIDINVKSLSNTCNLHATMCYQRNLRHTYIMRTAQQRCWGGSSQ